MVRRTAWVIWVVTGVLVTAGLGWATVVGTWDVNWNGTVRVKVGSITVVQGVQAEDVFIFLDNGSFEALELNGTWTQKKRKFTVQLDTSAIEQSVEAALLDQGYDVDIYIRKVAFSGTESRDGSTIHGKCKAQADLEFRDSGKTGKATISMNFSGRRSETFASGGYRNDISPPTLSRPIFGAVGTAMGSLPGMEIPH